MKHKLFIVISLLAVLALAACGPISTKAVNTPTLAANGTGIVYLTPDVAYINIGVHSQAENVGDAMSQNSTQAAAVSDAIKAFGVEAKDIQTSAFNVYPQQQYSPEGQLTSTLYMVDNTVYVTVRNLSDLGKILDATVKSGANTINGISFDVLDKESALKDARLMAIEKAKAQAQELASAAGVTLGSLQSLNVYTSGNTVPMYDGKGGAAMAAPGQAPISAGQLTITVEANLMYEIK
jgi:uncharacterized protein YggE